MTFGDAYCTSNFGGPALPSPDSALNSIFWSGQDQEMLGTLDYYTEGEVGRRIFVLRFEHLVFCCSNVDAGPSSGALILHEGSNTVELQLAQLFVRDSAQIGMQNGEANWGIVAPGRSIADRGWTATNEGWIFFTTPIPSVIVGASSDLILSPTVAPNSATTVRVDCSAGSLSPNPQVILAAESIAPLTLVYSAPLTPAPIVRCAFSFVQGGDARLAAAEFFPPPIFFAVADPNSGVVGDPILTGFLGQKFQVHGIDRQVYDLVSAADLQLNAQFVFLGQGESVCTSEIKNRTQCWTHAGSYIGDVGVSWTRSKGRNSNNVSTVLIKPGAAREGLSIEIDGKRIARGENGRVHMVQMRSGKWKSLSADIAEEMQAETERGGLSASALPPVVEGEFDGAIESTIISAPFVAAASAASSTPSLSLSHSYRLICSSPFECSLLTPDFRFSFSNADRFLNQKISLTEFGRVRFTPRRVDDDEGETDVSPLSLHGVLGQTLVDRRYSNVWKYIEGSVEAYATAGIFEYDDEFARFKHKRNDGSEQQ